MNRYIEVNELPRLKFHPLPYTHITPADIKDAEAYERGWNDAIDAIIENAPTADVVEVKHGMWIEYNYPGAECVYCSKCKEEYYPDDLLLGANDYPNFCPHCGAKMDGGKDDDRNR